MDQKEVNSLLEKQKPQEEYWTSKVRARQIVEEIVADLCGRSGLQNEWEQIDSETTEEIMDRWVAIVLRASV